jgi:hypothetical protein
LPVRDLDDLDVSEFCIQNTEVAVPPIRRSTPALLQ